MDRKTVTQTFRIDQESHDALVDEARTENLTLTSIINKVLTRYVQHERVATRHHFMRFCSSPILSTLLEGVSEEYMEGRGRRLGGFHPRDYLSALSFPIAPSSFPTLLEHLSKYSFWFKLERYEEHDRTIFHLRTELGSKWSVFLRSYMEVATKSVFQIPASIDMTEFSVTIRVLGLVPRQS